MTKPTVDLCQSTFIVVGLHFNLGLIHVYGSELYAQSINAVKGE